MRKVLWACIEDNAPLLVLFGALIVVGATALAPSLIGLAFLLFGAMVTLIGMVGWVMFNDKYR